MFFGNDQHMALIDASNADLKLPDVILRMLGCEIVLRALAPLSDVIATNLLIPTLPITSSITLDIQSAVCLLSERSSRFKRYSFLWFVISINAHTLLPHGSVQPSNADFNIM